MQPLEPNPSAYEHVLGLRVVRRFLPEPLSSDDIAAILEAGRWTGSSKNQQAWAFVVLDDRPALDNLATAGHFTAPLSEATLALAIVRLPDGNNFDVGRAAQNMMLAAAARGIGSCPITLHETERAADVLGLPAGHSCRWAIAFGFPDIAAEEYPRSWPHRTPPAEATRVPHAVRGLGGTATNPWAPTRPAVSATCCGTSLVNRLINPLQR